MGFGERLCIYYGGDKISCSEGLWSVPACPSDKGRLVARKSGGGKS